MSADWLSALASAGTVLIAAYVALFGLHTFEHQRQVNEINLGLQIFSEINRYWDRVVEGSDNPTYEYGQILTYFEVAAAMFNRGTLSNAAGEILKDHIIEVFSQLSASHSGKALLDQCRSANSTFEQLEKFAKKNFPRMLLANSFGLTKR